MRARRTEGPFRAEYIRSGDPYELSNGHPVYCAPTGGSGSGPNQLGASVIGWDPAVKEAGVDAGYAPTPKVLRAPDVAVGNVPNKPRWIPGVPELAVEYADIGQDEEALHDKIRDLLAGGTRYLWVVRLAGPRRVEVHEPGKPMLIALPGEHLHAPGVLQNPVLVESLYDRSEAERATLTNLLQRRGFADLEAVLAAGRREGFTQGIEKGIEQGIEKGRDEGRLLEARAALRRVLARRKLGLRPVEDARIEACADLAALARWLEQAIDAMSAEEALR